MNAEDKDEAESKVKPMEVSNEISVAFGALKTKTTKEIYRLDEEQYLVFADIELPGTFRADFGLSETGDTISMIGTENRVMMPDELLLKAGKLHCWVWLDTGEYGGKTEYHVIVPIKQRGNVTDIQPTPAEQSTIDSLIDALNDGVDRAEDAADEAILSAGEASRSAERAEAAARAFPTGGTTGQVLKKASDADYDTEWADESGGGGLPEGGQVGDLLTKISASGAGWVTPASSAEQDNTRPITAAAVYMEIGNINALLVTI